MDKDNPKYKSIRIPLESYDLLKQLSKQNHRSIVAEIMLILNEKVKQDSTTSKEKISEPEHQKRLKAIDQLCGIIDDMPAADYSGSIDDVLYGEEL
ncbi:MAG: Arc family DNA-binding protein [Candidatus Melainabacteria bacterium]|jgi:hypothetical protein|nr:Arc family DNA-binding protein [Candidatus Melainabacteria bacterium]